MPTTNEDVRRRITKARRSGMPHWLWPEIQPASWRAALLDIERVTRPLLSDETGVCELQRRDVYDLDSLGVAAYTSGMGPLLGYWVAAGRLSVDPETARMLDVHLQHARLRMTRLTHETVVIAERCADAGIELVLLKGMHTAHSFFPEPGTRTVADIDVLVLPGQRREFERILRDCDYYQHERQHSPDKAEWRKRDSPDVPGSLTFAHADDAVAVDLHTSLDRNFFGVRTIHLRIPPRAENGTCWRGHSNVRVLREPQLTLFLALHASEGLHNLRLLRLVELALVIKAGRSSGTLDWAELLDTARAARALRFAYPALALTRELMPDLMPSSVLDDFAEHATPALRRVVASLTPATAQRIDRLSAEERWMWAGTRSERIRRGLHALWPSPAGWSLPRLAGIYARRAWSLLRGTPAR